MMAGQPSKENGAATFNDAVLVTRDPVFDGIKTVKTVW
jgi:hypothetical protein